MTDINPIPEPVFPPLDMDDEPTPAPGDWVAEAEKAFPARPLGEAEDYDASLKVQTIAPQGSDIVLAGGAGGWYGADSAQELKGAKGRVSNGTQGDTYFSAVGTEMRIDGMQHQGGEAITATPLESACLRARRIGGIDWSTRLEPVARNDGKSIADPYLRHSYWLIRNDTDEPIAMVGRVAAGFAKKDAPATVNPAPRMLQPSALDIADNLPGFSVSRGGCIGGTVPWIQGADMTYRMPNGQEMSVKPTLTNPLDGSGSFALALPSLALECRNFYASIFGSRKGVFRIKHCASNEKQLEALGKALAQMDGRIAKGLEFLANAQSARISEDWLTSTFLPKVLGYDKSKSISELPTKTRNRIDAIMAAYREAPGAEVGTAFGALQAVTYWTSHGYTSKGGATMEQVMAGSAGAFEERAVQQVSVLLN